MSLTKGRLDIIGEEYGGPTPGLLLHFCFWKEHSDTQISAQKIAGLQHDFLEYGI
ncbi:MAG: hypothetical protein HQ517_14775 [SAR324 cluster bacterium]|nr:hypothetical protein [SAR324 cluster bacterium]